MVCNNDEKYICFLTVLIKGNGTFHFYSTLHFTKHFHLPSCLVIVTTALVHSGVRVILFSKIVKQRLMRSRKWAWEQGSRAPRLEPLVVKKRQGWPL